MKNIRLKYFLPLAVALLVLTPAALVAWTSWNAARDAAEVVARALMNQAAIRLDGETRADLGQASQLLDSFAKSSDGNQQIPDINKVQPITNFEGSAWGPVRGQDLVRYAYFGNTKGEFLGVDATNTAPGKQTRVRVGVRSANETRRWFFFAALPGDRSEPDTTDSADYDPRTRPWYKAAVDAAKNEVALSASAAEAKVTTKRAWTSVYPSFSKNELLVTQSVAVYDGDAALAGVIAVDLSLKRLGAALKSLKISPNGVAFIVDEKGLLVATSSNDAVTGTKDSPRMLASAATNDFIKTAAGQAFMTATADQGKSVDFHKFNVADQAVIAHVAALSYSGDGRAAAANMPKWRLVIAAPESDFTGAFNAKLKSAVFWAIGLFLLAIIIGVWLAQRLVGSVSQVVEAAARIGKGDLSRPKIRSRFDEFQKINHEMGDTADALRQSRDELMAQNQMLEQKVAERTKDLQFQTEEALQAVRAKASFLATMSHEIRTPMNGVIGMTGLLAGTPLNIDQRDYVETIRTSGDALLTIINDILDFSKIESGKMTLEREPLTLLQVIEESFSLVGPYANQKGLELLVEIDPDVPQHILGDVTRLRQIFINLINNAVKFTDHGEVIVHGRKGVGDAIYCDITDTGIGIPPDRINALFAAFTQVDVTTTRKHGGTGLGLAISKRLAELMGGDIKISSVLGQGSTFSISIEAPKSEAPTQTALNARNNNPAALMGKPVLIVDDNPTHLRILAKRLQMWGMHVTTALGPNRALEILATKQHFDVAIIDYVMAPEDGLSLGKKIRANAATAKLPLIMLTSVTTSRNDDSTQLFGAHLVKPPRESQLLDALMTAVFGASSDHSASTVHAPAGAGIAIGIGIGQQFASLHPIKMLVVDDNAVNRKVATIMLSKLGYSAKTADDGQAALADIFAAQMAGDPYQLVWMDVHMPNMDGYEATKILRDPEKGCANLRIVAMTAAAMEGDRETCIEAGMDDYVSKPLQHRELVLALERAIATGICPPIASTSASGSVSANVSAAAGAEAVSESLINQTSSPSASLVTVKHFDPERLDELAEYDEDGSLVNDLAEVFCKQAPEMAASIEAANASGDSAALISAAHQLKGAASNIGVTSVFNAADLLEKLARSGGLAEVNADEDGQAALKNLAKNLSIGMAAVREYAAQVRARALAAQSADGAADPNDQNTNNNT